MARLHAINTQDNILDLARIFDNRLITQGATTILDNFIGRMSDKKRNDQSRNRIHNRETQLNRKKGYDNREGRKNIRLWYAWHQTPKCHFAKPFLYGVHNS